MASNKASPAARWTSELVQTNMPPVQLLQAASCLLTQHLSVVPCLCRFADHLRAVVHLSFLAIWQWAAGSASHLVACHWPPALPSCA